MKGDYYSADDIVRFAREQKVKETGAYSKGLNNGLNIIISALLSNCTLPPAKVAPVYHSRWIERGNGWECKRCSYVVRPWNNTQFCPRCGAIMDLEE